MSDSSRPLATSDPLSPGSIPSFRAGATAIQSHYHDLILLIVCLVAAIPMLYLAATQFVEYDGFWHVFIAQQDNFRAFWWEYMHNDHPLLFYLALKVVVSFGHSVLLYRAIPLASGLGAVFVLGRIARKLSSSPFTPPLTALAFGLSMPAIEIAVSVRSYMFSIFFALAACVLLKFVVYNDRPPERIRDLIEIVRCFELYGGEPDARPYEIAEPEVDGTPTIR